ncbi:MAG: hypothetical protein JNL38_15365 [Myxococcales bacterium]|jgi:hypothetical protein|nr:hypothetical protein [Myxococcales bacterium]
MRHRLVFASLTAVASLATILVAACAETAAEIGESDASAPPLDVGAPPPDPDGGAGKDAGKDAALDAPVDAPRDAALDAPGDAATSASVRIAELYFDPGASYGDGAEYVELRGAPGTPVGDLRLRLVHETGGVKYDVAVGSATDVIGPTGTWVVGGGSVFKVAAQNRVDTVVSLAQWGLSAGSGSVQLVRGPSRDLVDVVGYGGAVSPPATAPTQTVEGTVAAVPTLDKHGIGRKPAAADTNDNSKDFCSMLATPGFPQAACD